MKFSNYLMIISGPILAMSIACGSFAIVACAVKAISHTSPEILKASHYKNIEAYGKDATAQPVSPAGSSPTTVQAIIDSKGDKDFACSLKNEKNDTFDCKIDKAQAPDDEKSQCTTTSSADGSYKITAAKDKLKGWETNKEIYIWIIDKSEKDKSKKIKDPYAKITVELATYAKKTECATIKPAS